MRRLPLVAALALTAGSLTAQTATSITQATATITAEDVARHVGVIADDSMGGRDTPSPGLEKTARYVADQFKKFGLKPGGDSGTWFQRYATRNDTATAPNTVGILEGSDPNLNQEYVVFVAHMDHVGFRSGRGQVADSIYNGAVDNASGTASVLELAEAFTQAGARPRRSLIFVTVGGEEGGLLGSRHFVKHPPAPIEQLVAAINLDMVAGRRGDTVSVHGGLDSYLGAIVARVDSAHPELRLTVLLEEGASGGSDHTSFRAQGVPFLFFHAAVREYPHYHQVTDSPEKIDAAMAAHLLQLVFRASQEAASADPRPPSSAAGSTTPKRP
jgi:Zn-dependent M28 family amino/carboxypeptidase